ncbi:TonB-dependent receptor [Haliea sp. E17]|uniref:TonB-dependent receptor n=1 Tax=Haliea sp. E17 TaxID=3401576 RepID=UPI003AABDF20
MSMSRFTAYPLAAAVSAALGLAATAQAQEATVNPQDAVAPMEEVYIIGTYIRDSNQAAIDAKRLADNYVDIVSADTIGQFPDQNLADSLGRLPGLAIERDQGQARYINLRGAPFRYTSIAFDGIDVPGAENGRIPRFDSFPSVITSRVEANKAILPSMPGESVAGFINIHTFNPFDQEGFSFASDIGSGEQDLGGGDVSKYALRGSWSNDNVGLMLFGSQNSREQITDNREYSLDRNEAGELLVDELDFRSYKVTREDEAYGGHLEFRGDGALERLFVSTLYSEFVDREERNQFVFSALEEQVGTTGEDVLWAVSRALEAGKYENSTDTSTLGADFAAAGWDLEARINYTETTFGMNLPLPRSVGAVVQGDYDLSDLEDPLLYLDQDLSSLQYSRDLGIHYVQKLDIEATKYKLDATRESEWFGQPATFALGLAWDSRDADGYVATPLVGAFPSSINVDDYNTGKGWDSNTTNSIGGTYYDNKGLRNAWATDGDLSIAGKISPDDMIVLEEDILAAYVQAKTGFDWGNLIAGVRVEQTDYTSEGTLGDEPISVEEKFTNWLPSLHLNVDLADDLKWRTSFSSGINRPTYSEWRAAASIDVIQQTVTGGNPTLDPEEAMGVDTALEWYFAPASLVSVGAFYRQIENVIYTDVSAIDGGTYLPSAAGEQWEFYGAVNGNDGEMQGLELNLIAHADHYLPEIFSGFGVSANVTFLDSEFETLEGDNLRLPGTSDMIYNASLFYENFGLSARLNYQWRDEWISPIEDPTEYWGEQERLDLSLVYTLPLDWEGFAVSVYANANNLTDETDVRYDGNGTINQAESYGRRYLLGFRVNY